MLSVVSYYRIRKIRKRRFTKVVFKSRSMKSVTCSSNSHIDDIIDVVIVSQFFLSLSHSVSGCELYPRGSMWRNTVRNFLTVPWRRPRDHEIGSGPRDSDFCTILTPKDLQEYQNKHSLHINGIYRQKFKSETFENKKNILKHFK